MENSFSSIIKEAKAILILLPTSPYFDQVAAALGLFNSLKQHHNVEIACPTPMTVEFNRLVGVNKIASELGNKNLVIRFPGYKADGIERVSYDLEGDEIVLKVIPKPQVTPPKKEQIDLQYTGILSDLVILIGGGNETHFPALNSKDFLDVKLVHVGIKELRMPQERPVMSFAKLASSISEVVAGLIKENNLFVNEDIATNLVMGIEDATRHFTGGEVTADTFQSVAELMRAGGKRLPRRDERERRSYPPGSIPGEKLESAPKSWFEPKIYKGTSVS